MNDNDGAPAYDARAGCKRDFHVFDASYFMKCLLYHNLLRPL